MKKTSKAKKTSSKKSTAQWIHLEMGNDWGFNYYALKARDEGGYDDRSQALKLTEGEKVRVRFPDKTVEEVVLKVREETESVSDHGHSSDVTSNIYFFDHESRGLNFEVSIADVEVERAWAEALPRLDR